MVFAVIVAGGTGTRMGAALPKQFLNVGGIPVIIRTLGKFTSVPDISHVIVLVPGEWKDYTEELVFKKNDFKKEDVSVICGGKSRNDTILKAVEFISGKYGTDDDTVMITHDSVRPFVTERIIKDNIQAMKNECACTTVIPSTDTILESADGKSVTGTLDRSILFNCQTPQSFKVKLWYELYSSASPEKREKYTDASSVIMDAGRKVGIVRGEVSNIKITYPEDMIIAEAFAAEMSASDR